MKKEILIVTHYFPPEKGAAANRIHSMVQGFSKNDYKVLVACPLPNYPQGKLFKGYQWKLFTKNKASFGSVFRLWVWPTKSSNKFIRLISMLSFSFSLQLFLLFKKTPKIVVIQYSPIFVGFTGVIMSKLLRKKVILNVSDLWPLAGVEMGLLNKGFYYRVLTKMERFCYRNSQLILGQSEEILDHIDQLETKTPLFLYRNYPDFEPLIIRDSNNMNEEIKIVYAGLLGVAQGLYKICNEVSFSKKISLHIYGAGPEAEKIQNLKKPHIYYYGEIERDKLHIELQKYDIGFVPLVQRIYGSVPSKIFELSRLGIPVLYYAGGEGGNLVIKNNLGWVVEVNNITELQNFMNTLNKEKVDSFSKKEIQAIAIKSFNFFSQFQKLNKKMEKI